jgi:lysophospholipase L1-like esterase
LTTPPRYVRGFRSELALALLALVALLAGLEWAVGRWIQTPSTAVYDPRFGLVQRPHARVVQSMEGWTEARANSLGLFDDELREPKPPLRALLLGDSYAEALQMRRDRNFSSVAERDLPGLEVVNAAGSGRFLAHYAGHLATTIEAVRPDLVVIQVNDGDVLELGDPAKLGEARAELQGRSEFQRAEANAGGSLPGRLRALFKRSALVKYLSVRLALLDQHERERFARKFLPAAGPPVDPNSVPASPTTIATTDSLMNEIVALSPRPILVYIPFLDYFAAKPAEMYPNRRAFWRAVAERHHVTLIDPTDALLAEFRRTGQPLHGFDNSRLGAGHLNALGHAIVGRMLADTLAERMP